MCFIATLILMFTENKSKNLLKNIFYFKNIFYSILLHPTNQGTNEMRLGCLRKYEINERGGATLNWSESERLEKREKFSIYYSFPLVTILQCIE